LALALPTVDLATAYSRVVALLAEAREIVLLRAAATPPSWCLAHGWQGYLLGLSEAALECADTEGIAAWFLADPDCPSSLRDLAEQVRAFLALVPVVPGLAEPAELPFMNVRKRGQVAAMVRVLRESFPDLQEIVDVGAGSGHLTRRASAELSVAALGLERDPERVAVARTLAGDLPVRFVTSDVLSAADNPLATLPQTSGRLLVALHGCGELGDAVVTAAAAARAQVLLLGCCPQKIRGAHRTPLVPGGPSFPREILGLANVMARTAGVEGDLRRALATKESRLALRSMLAERGVSIPAGEEMRGVNRRKASAGFAVFAEAVCRARAFLPPSCEEVAAAADKAHAHYVAQRRLSLPRSMLGRVLESFLALDRALFLQTCGYRATVVELFAAAYSPRNLAVLGWPE
jgi:hypothetical protein